MHDNPFRGKTVGKPKRQNRPGDGEFSGLRVDGTPKGRGYLGPLENRFGQTMTEYSIGVGLGGKEVEIPTLVPTLNQREIAYLLNKDDSMPILPSIEQKAIDHAIKRISEGMNPFSDSPIHALSKRLR